MALEVFNPPLPPSPGTGDRPQINILKAQFGDGYVQHTRNGINHIRRVLTLEWKNLDPDSAEEILEFFVRQGGDTSFWYTPSDEGVPLRWTCQDWRDKRENNGLRTIQATLEQSFNING